MLTDKHELIDSFWGQQRKAKQCWQAAKHCFGEKSNLHQLTYLHLLSLI